MSNKLPPKRSHSDLIQWLDNLGLEKRKNDFLKNIATAIADGVLVAEIIHCIYPKLIQLHNYYETHSTQGRKTNWLLLNKKVLKHIRCEATDIEIETFIKRQSQDDAILFLRNLKSRLPAYEPLYLSGHYEVKQPSKRLSSKPRADQAQALLSQMMPPPPPPDSPPPPRRSSSVSTLSSSSTMASKKTSQSNGSAQPNRRSSAIMNEKILAAKKKNTEEAKRRASMLTPRDMDQMYSTLATSLKTTSLSMAQQSEELDQKSALMDAKFAALRRQNQEDILKADRRLSMARTEERDILRGQEVFDVDERVFNYLEDPKRAIELKDQLKEEYRRASVALMRYQHNYEEDGNEVRSPPIESSGYGHGGYTPYTPPTAGDAIRKASMSMINSTFPVNQEPSVTSSISNVSSARGKHVTESTSEKSRKSPSKATRSPSILYSESFSTPMSKLKESLHNTALTSAVPSMTKETPPQKSPAPFTSPGGGVSSLSGNEESENDEPSENDSDSDEPSSDDDDEYVPPPPPKKTQQVITHVRHYSDEYKMHYYTLVNDSTGESDWVPPTTGVVQCTDEASGRVFYTESSTGKTAWDLNGF